MGCAVAITAFWKLLDHACWMRYAVTIRTLLYGLMFSRMTSRTGKVMVFCCICLKQGHRFFMASAAIVRRGFRGVPDHEGHMNRVTGLTGLKVHVGGMFFMAIHADGDQPVCGVALIARQIRVSTGVVVYFLTLLCVAGQAWSDKLTF
jgi:hypothetical protein